MKHLWPAEDYHNHSSIQNDAALDLLPQAKLKSSEEVLDVGCGDGKITATIAQHVPKGHAIGLDISNEMIDYAKKSFPNERYPNLTFQLLDAQQFNFCEKLDVIFSSFALQWLPNPDQFFKCAFKSLKSSGRIVTTIPLGISEELKKAISTVTSSPIWNPYFRSFSPDWHFLSDNKYKQLLVENNFIPTKFSVVSQTVMFSSREDFEKYVNPWFSYLQRLPQHLRQFFFNEIIEAYLGLTPFFENGNVSFKFLRLDLIAKKLNP